MLNFDIYPFWDKLADDEKTYIKESCYTQVFDKGMLIHRSQENCKGLMSVIEGQLRTYIVSEEGREVTLFRVPQGNVCVLSASCLMDSIEFDVVIEAMEETKVQILPSVTLNQIIKNNPYVELYLYKSASEKFTEVMWTMQQILFQKMDQRVAGFLLEELNAGQTDTLQITHDEIARYIGSAREVVTRVLKYLAEQNVIELGRGKIIVSDINKLKEYL